MKDKMKAAVLPGDERQSALSRILAARGFDVGNTVGDIDGAYAVVLPRYLPCELRDCVLAEVSHSAPDAIVFAWEHIDCGRYVVDLSHDEDFLWRNALLTAEGALCRAMTVLNIGICGARVLVVGGGRVAFCTAHVFGALGASVTLAARSASSRARASVCGFGAADIYSIDFDGFDVIINTVPAHVINADDVPAGRVLLELASPPYGFDLDRALARGVVAQRLPSLPAKYAPESAASLVADVVERELSRRSGGVL